MVYLKFFQINDKNEVTFLYSKQIIQFFVRDMKTLVLNVDRDDDFGRKAKVKGPIIGYAANLEAANKLGETDPEDSDLNAIFYAISIYNQLKKENKQVEIATLTGNISVGFKSDEILAKQLETVIEKTGVQDVILISDGAEDEHILPIIQSRIKITSINRVSVKQSRELEDTYYRVMKILEDEKVLKQFVLPISLVLIVWAFFAIIGMSSSGSGAIILTLGVFLLIRVFKWEKNIAMMWEDIKSGFLTGKLSIYTYIISMVILIAFGIYAYTAAYNAEDNTIRFWAVPILEFILYMIPGIVISGLLVTFGRSVDVYVKDKKVPLSYQMMPFSLLASAFISYAILNAIKGAVANMPAEISYDVFTGNFIFLIFIGITIALIGALIHHFKKENNQEQDFEKNKGKIAEKN